MRTKTTNRVNLPFIYVATKFDPRPFDCFLQTAWLATYNGTTKLVNLSPKQQSFEPFGSLASTPTTHIPVINLKYKIQPHMIPPAFPKS